MAIDNTFIGSLSRSMPDIINKIKGKHIDDVKYIIEDLGDRLEVKYIIRFKNETLQI